MEPSSTIAVPVNYSDLRATAASVIEFVKTEYWWEDDSNLKTHIEDDLGITGDDAAELMQKFSKKFNVDLTGFDFMKSFDPEGVDLSFLLLIPPLLIALLVALVKYSLIALAYIFSYKLYRRLRTFKARSIFEGAIKMLQREGRETLTIGDLVASAACGKFKLRREVQFKLV